MDALKTGISVYARPSDTFTAKLLATEPAATPLLRIGAERTGSPYNANVFFVGHSADELRAVAKDLVEAAGVLEGHAAVLDAAAGRSVDLGVEVDCG